jgi:phage terminase large subunit-like protein
MCAGRIDPSASATGDEAGIVVAGLGSDQHGYVLADLSVQGSPATWAGAAVAAYHTFSADRIVAESNNGGEMVEHTLRTVEGGRQVPYTMLHASRGKVTRAEPVEALYERGLVHHVGHFTALEDELCGWVPGMASPNRLDALVSALSELMLGDAALPFGWLTGNSTSRQQVLGPQQEQSATRLGASRL